MNSDNVSMYDALNRWKPRNGLKLSRGANCIALCPSSGHWHREYVAIGFSSGNIAVYNSSHKVTYKTSHPKSSILAAAFSLQVSWRGQLILCDCSCSSCRIICCSLGAETVCASCGTQEYIHSQHCLWRNHQLEVDNPPVWLVFILYRTTITSYLVPWIQE